MGNHQLTSLIKMANQIAANNTHIGDDTAEATMVADHMTKFWARPMKQQICNYLASDGSELCPVARQAVTLVKEE